MYMMSMIIVMMVSILILMIILMMKMITLNNISNIPGEATIPPPQYYLPAVPAVPGQSMTRGESDK